MVTDAKAGGRVREPERVDAADAPLDTVDPPADAADPAASPSGWAVPVVQTLPLTSGPSTAVDRRRSAAATTPPTTATG